MRTNEEIALEWWYNVGRHTHTKGQFLAHRNRWEDLEAVLRTENGNGAVTGEIHDETKNIISRLDKGGMLGHETLSDAITVRQLRELNKKEWGLPRGVPGLESVVSAMHAATSKRMPDSYRDYIVSSRWKSRAARYLNDRATLDGKWVCEICGTPHDIVSKGRTIQVHHNDYSTLNGSEDDANLMACCDDICHQMADILRRVKNGNVDAAILNDMMRPMFSHDPRENGWVGTDGRP